MMSGLLHGHAVDRRHAGGRYTPTEEYVTWINMRQRCRNPSDPRYPRYGGRGIEVCERWDSFAAFLEDMGPKPPGLTLERNDVNGNYEPGNCRWATFLEQLHNRRDGLACESCHARHRRCSHKAVR